MVFLWIDPIFLIFFFCFPSQLFKRAAYKKNLEVLVWTIIPPIGVCSLFSWTRKLFLVHFLFIPSTHLFTKKAQVSYVSNWNSYKQFTVKTEQLYAAQRTRLYLTEWCTFSHNNMEFSLACCFFQEGFHCAWITNSHDHFIRVDVLQCLHGNIVSCALCKEKSGHDRRIRSNISFTEHSLETKATLKMGCKFSLSQEQQNCFPYYKGSLLSNHV